jgi:hypothetical protein
MNIMIRAAAVAFALSTAMAAPAIAQANTSPLKAGSYWTVSGIKVKPGQNLRYANELASVWMKNQDYAKSKGWISGYHILSNPYPRSGEPNIYLVTVFNDMVDQAEADRRGVEMRTMNKQTLEQAQAAAAGRAEYTETVSTMLLREQVRR